MFTERIKRGVQILCDSVMQLWQHKILALYMAIGTFLFALIQYLASKSLVFSVPNQSGGTTIQYFTAWGSDVDKSLVKLVLNFGDTNAYLFLIIIIIAHALIMTSASVYLIHHVLHILKGEKTSFSTFIHEKMNLILIWSAITSIFDVLFLYVPSIQFNNVIDLVMNAHHVVAYLIMAIIVSLFSLLFTLVPAIIADEKTNIIDALKLSPRIVIHFWIELLTSAGILLALSMLIPLFVMWQTWNNPEVIHQNFRTLVVIIWIPMILIVTTLQIIKAQIYYHFYKQKEE